MDSRPNLRESFFNPSPMLDILYQDDYLIAVNKPHGLFVHRTTLDPTATEFALQMVRDMVGSHVYSVHRLDRKTSGVLLFARDQETQSALANMFINKRVDKKYLAIVRGYTEDQGTIDYILVNDDGKKQEAITHYKTLSRTEIPYSSGKFLTSRYSLVEVTPETGRMHQIRKHMSHIFHPIIGDRPHGCNKQNRFFLEQFAMETMMLHASEVIFIHPVLHTEIQIKAPYHQEFSRMIKLLGFDMQLNIESKNDSTLSI
jgi:tRNA pseudouridine65 synthase